MSDSTSILDTIQVSQSSKEVTANALFEGSMLIFAKRDSTTAALTWGFYGGRYDGTAIANGTVALTASATNYIVAHRTTFVVTAATNTTNWNNTSTYGRMYKVTVGSSAPTGHEDHRWGSGGICTPTGGAPSGAAGGDLTGTYPNPTLAAVISAGGPTGDGTHVAQITWDAKGRLTAVSSVAITGAAPSGAAGGDLTGTYPNPTITTNAVTNAKSAQMAAHTYKGNSTGSTADPSDVAAATLAADLGTNVKSLESIIVACSDESTALTTGTGKVTFRMPYAFTVTAVRASLSTAQASGSIFTVDINESGTTIISTKITIDNTEKTSTTAATPAVISDSSLADDAEMTVDIDQVGDGTAKGLKIVLIGNRT